MILMYGEVKLQQLLCLPLMCTTGEQLRCISAAGRNMFNDIIVWASARACFKLLISFICQTVKVVCVGWLSNSRRWLMKKKKREKKNLLWGWEPQKVRCGWYNGPVMIWDAALGGKKKKKKKRNTGHKVRLFIHSAELLSTVCYWWKYITYLLLYIAWNNTESIVMYQRDRLESYCFWLFFFRLLAFWLCGSRIPMSLTLHTTEIWLNTRTDSGGMKDRTHGIFLQKKESEMWDTEWKRLQFFPPTEKYKKNTKWCTAISVFIAGTLSL